MPTTVTQLFDGNTEVLTGPVEAELAFLVMDAADESAVYTACVTPVTGVPDSYRSMPRSAMRIAERINETTWKVTANYKPLGPQQRETIGSDTTFTFETGGGQAHITQSRGTTKFPAAAADMKGAIGFDGETVNGVDIVIPNYEWTEQYWFASGVVTNSYKLALADATGCVNDATFRGFPAGEVLFMGASGTKQGNGVWYITFKFARQKNEASFDVGDVTGVSKQGWQHMWVLYNGASATVSGVEKVIKKAGAVYIENVYDSIDFATLGIGTT